MIQIVQSVIVNLKESVYYTRTTKFRGDVKWITIADDERGKCRIVIAIDVGLVLAGKVIIGNTAVQDHYQFHKQQNNTHTANLLDPPAPPPLGKA